MDFRAIYWFKIVVPLIIVTCKGKLGMGCATTLPFLFVCVWKVRFMSQFCYCYMSGIRLKCFS